MPQEIVNASRFRATARMKEVFLLFAANHILVSVSGITESYLVPILGKSPKSLSYLHKMEEMLKDFN